ncbi:TPA: hypothetical protein L3V69_002219 [Vibrio parahaemolyticus]|uniref:hypothetical protein n=1 Tax=Vibrio harveyi group TaxID=717610 RepID=UPI001302F5AA|nr:MULTISPECIES: hypothetical protein [Vibrio harveyi group]EGQ7837243.1 hypothetical protein [Vibrio parahaemolyticus]ELB2080938.1 hypothetical protein [Vibrio parahaemolyticus]ELJ8872124.1 hypothetical protein [Vibrio parahaemolyticus]ELX9386783.1 hypothetical protein [Vibrio parahaemolyticus]MBS9969672.1 hypothetical protein [Vibrio alginolyticus]
MVIEHYRNKDESKDNTLIKKEIKNQNTNKVVQMKDIKKKSVSIQATQSLIDQASKLGW